jgi:hypothetical protein
MDFLKNYENACKKVFLAFIEQYFSDYSESGEYFFVSDDPTGVLCISDYYFGLDDVITALRYHATYDDIFEWYNYKIDCAMQNRSPKINFQNWILYPDMRPAD